MYAGSYSLLYFLILTAVKDSKKIDEKDEKIIRESIPLTSSAAPFNTFVALDESDIQILKTYVRVHLRAFRRRAV